MTLCFPEGIKNLPQKHGADKILSGLVSEHYGDLT